MPLLTARSSPVAAFMPSAPPPQVDPANMRGGIFWIVARRRPVLVGRSGIITPYARRQHLPQDLRKHHHGGDPYDTPFYAAARLDSTSPLERRWLVIGATVAHWPWRSSPAVRAAAILPQQLAARTGRRAAPEGRLFVGRTDRTQKMERGSSRRTRTSASSPRTRAPASPASTCRSIPNCRTRATRSSSS